VPHVSRLRALRSDLIDPTIAAHHGLVVKRTGDGAIVEFRSVVDAVRWPSKFRTPWSSVTPRVRGSQHRLPNWHSPR
jgi:class 3 adenylate cyclase